MQPQVYRSAPKTTFSSFAPSPKIQTRPPPIQYPPNNVYSSPKYINQGPMRVSQQIPYNSPNNYYSNQKPQYIMQNQPGMPPILTDQQYKKLYVNKQKKSSIMVIPSQQPIHQPTKSIKGSILRQSNFQEKSLHQSSYSHRAFDYTVQPQKIFCVICEKTYTLDQQEEHLNTHKNRLHREDFHPIKNIQTEQVLNNLQLHKASRFNLVNDNTSFSKRDGQKIIKPIVQPEQYNIQYNPNEFIVTKNVQYISKQMPPPPLKTYQSFGIGDDDVRPPQRVTNRSDRTSSVEPPVSFILSQSDNVEKKQSKRLSNTIEIIPQDNQRQQYDKDQPSLKNTSQNAESFMKVDKNQSYLQPRQSVLNQQIQNAPIKAIQPIILDIFNTQNNPQIQTQEMSFDQNYPAPMYRRVKQNYQYLPRSEIVNQPTQPLDQQKIQAISNDQIEFAPKRSQNCNQCEYQQQQPRQKTFEQNKVNVEPNRVSKQSLIDIRFSDRISQQPLENRQTYKRQFVQPSYPIQQEIKFEDIIQQKNPIFIKQQSPSKIIQEGDNKSFFHSNTPRQTEDYKFVIEQQPQPQLPQASKISNHEPTSSVSNAPTFNPTTSSQNQGKKKKIPRNMIW